MRFSILYIVLVLFTGGAFGADRATRQARRARIQSPCPCWILEAVKSLPGSTKVFRNIVGKCSYIDRSVRDAAGVILGHHSLESTETLTRRAASSNLFEPFRLFGESPETSIRESMFALFEIGVQRALDEERGINLSSPAARTFRQAEVAIQGVSISLGVFPEFQEAVTAEINRLGLPSLVVTEIAPVNPLLLNEASLVQYIGNAEFRAKPPYTLSLNTPVVHLFLGEAHWSVLPGTHKQLFDIFTNEWSFGHHVWNSILSHRDDFIIYVHTKNLAVRRPRHHFSEPDLYSYLQTLKPEDQDSLQKSLAKEIIFNLIDYAGDDADAVEDPEDEEAAITNYAITEEACLARPLLTCYHFNRLTDDKHIRITFLNE